MPADVTEQEARVARAICAAQGLDPDYLFFGQAAYPQWRNFIRQARAAMDAMLKAELTS